MLKIFTHLADWLTFEIMNLTSGTKIADAVHFFIEDTSKIFVLLAVMIYVVGFIRAGVDANRIRDYLVGKNRILCYVLAAILGAVTPFCSCSSIPLFLGFMAARIPVGIAMAFLITSPCVNEAAVAMFASSLGWTLTSVYVALGVMSGIVGGLFFDLIRAERLLAVGNVQKPAADVRAPHRLPNRQSCRLKTARRLPPPKRRMFSGGYGFGCCLESRSELGFMDLFLTVLSPGI